MIALLEYMYLGVLRQAINHVTELPNWMWKVLRPKALLLVKATLKLPTYKRPVTFKIPRHYLVNIQCIFVTLIVSIIVPLVLEQISKRCFAHSKKKKALCFE